MQDPELKLYLAVDRATEEIQNKIGVERVEFGLDQ